MSHPDLDPVDQRVAPIVLALGRAVLGASALEKLLLVDIAQRRANAEGLTKQLSEQLAELARRPAGELLRTLREIGVERELAKRIEAVIARRNRLVHGAMADPISPSRSRAAKASTMLSTTSTRSPPTSRRS